MKIAYPALAYEEALQTSKLQPLSIGRDASCKKFVESLRRDASPYYPLTKIMEISPRIRTHDYDLRNDHSDQTLLLVMSDRFKNFVTRKYYSYILTKRNVYLMLNVKFLSLYFQCNV